MEGRGRQGIKIKIKIRIKRELRSRLEAVNGYDLSSQRKAIVRQLTCSGTTAA
jgi:hypothetical protein